MVKILLIKTREDIQPLEILEEKPINEHFYNSLLRSSLDFVVLEKDLEDFKINHPFKSFSSISLDIILNDLWQYDIILEENRFDHHKLFVFLPV